jgi:hypothetical protein
MLPGAVSCAILFKYNVSTVQEHPSIIHRIANRHSRAVGIDERGDAKGGE